MQFDYYQENPYKKNEASFNAEKYKESRSSDKQLLFRLFDKLELL